jgi:hypothetical protein
MFDKKWAHFSRFGPQKIRLPTFARFAPDWFQKLLHQPAFFGFSLETAAGRNP